MFDATSNNDCMATRLPIEGGRVPVIMFDRNRTPTAKFVKLPRPEGKVPESWLVISSIYPVNTLERDISASGIVPYIN